MAGQCSICLCDYVDPVSIPCGHVYCLRCITDHGNAPSNQTMTAKCPTCRSDFQLAIPDLAVLPKKYHAFLTSHLRRVYIDDPTDASLRERLERSEQRIAKYQRQEEELMQMCERHIQKTHALQERERQARLQLEKERASVSRYARDLAQLEETVETQKGALEAYECQNKNSIVRAHWLLTSNRRLEKQCAELTKTVRSLEEGAASAPQPRRRVHRTSSYVDDSAASSCPFSDLSDAEDAVSERVVRPLPQRFLRRPSAHSPLAEPEPPAIKRPRLAKPAVIVGKRGS